MYIKNIRNYELYVNDYYSNDYEEENYLRGNNGFNILITVLYRVKQHYKIATTVEHILTYDSIRKYIIAQKLQA